MVFLLVAGSTATARIDGITAAGATPALRRHTPAADLEIVRFGDTVRAPVAPVSPDGTPTPAVVTRAVHELADLDTVAIDAGLGAPTAAPTVTLRTEPGRDVRGRRAVPSANALREHGRAFARQLPSDGVTIAETVPGGTTTAMGVLAALGERTAVSSSLPDNPRELKHRVVEEGLAASGLSRGDAAGAPGRAVAAMGDPVLCAVLGLIEGCAERGADVTLAGGTQMAAAAALARHDGVDAPLTIATTRYVADDPSSGFPALADDLDCRLRVVDPGFADADHDGLAAYADGMAKEGVGMGGALLAAREAGVSTGRIAERAAALTERLLDGERATEATP